MSHGHRSNAVTAFTTGCRGPGRTRGRETPQGATVSRVLTNVYLHYVLVSSRPFRSSAVYASSHPFSGVRRLKTAAPARRRPVVELLADLQAYWNRTRRSRSGTSELSFCFGTITARGKSRHGIRPSLHPGGLRCDSVTYSRYAPSSRLVRRAQERSRCSRDFHHGLIKVPLVGS